MAFNIKNDFERMTSPCKINCQYEVIDHSHNSDYPICHNFYDVINNADQLIHAVTKNPSNDIVYHFPCLFRNTNEFDKEANKVKPYPQSFIDQKWDWCIAGSKALGYIQDLLNRALRWKLNKKNDETRIKEIQAKVTELVKLTGLEKGSLNNETYLNFVRLNWDRLPYDTEVKTKIKELIKSDNIEIDKIYGTINPGDTDIFFLNSEINNRLVLPGIDLVHTKAKSVEELILNFDLPCCRAAFNSKHDFWISSQCLYSLLTGKYYLPLYLKNRDSFNTLLLQHRNGDPMKVTDNFLYERLIQRITKYHQRGFKCEWVDTDEVLPWIKNRFHYGEWKQ